RRGTPKTPFYLTGQVAGQPFSVHAEGERKILIGAGGRRQEGELLPPQETVTDLPEPVCPAGVVMSRALEGSEEPPAPGESRWKEGLAGVRVAAPEDQGGGV